MLAINHKRINILLILITLFLCYLPLCHRINNSCIQLWDESRNVCNAIEMLNNHKWLERYFENQPDMWESKPPFLVWCQALSFKILGFNELAARFPSMFFSMSTVLLLIWTGFKITGKIYSGSLASIILASSFGYIGNHGVRFGDHEATLSFFSTCLVCFSYFYFTTKQNQYLVIVFISLFLGWFTKSVVIFMFIPPLLLWAAANNYLREIIIKKHFWIGFILLVGAIICYYWLREKLSPGYFQHVWSNEFFGRYFGNSKEFVYKKDYWYYLRNFFDGRFFLYLIVFSAGTIYTLINATLPYRKFLIYLFVVFITFLVLISVGTKNFWYDIPLYPIAALALGIIIIQVYQKLNNNFLRIGYCIICVIIIYSCYDKVYHSVFSPDQKNDENKSMCYFLREESKILPKQLTIIRNGYFTPFYLYIENAKLKNKLYTLSKTLNIQPGDTFLIYEKNLIHTADSIFNTKLIMEKEGSQLKYVVGIKSSE